MKLRVIQILFMLVAFSSEVSAEQVLRSMTIKNVIVNLSSGVHFQINETMPNPDACSSGAWYKIDSDSKYEKEAFALILSYQAQDKPITIYLKGCTGSYPKVEYIY